MIVAIIILVVGVGAFFYLRNNKAASAALTAAVKADASKIVTEVKAKV